MRPALPTNEKQIWIKLLHLDLELHPPQAAILSLVLAAEPGSSSKVQLGLFNPLLPEPSRLDITLAHIRTIVGEENVGRAVLKDTHGPEGFRMESFAVPVGQPIAGPSQKPRTATRMLRPPESIAVTVHKERPQSFRFRERIYLVEHAYGPWAASGEWWASTLWGQEQWDLLARAHEGSFLCCCIVRDRLQNSWQMAALYD